ncbi:hypothetical protein L202_05590 [Cryptococcus amylolentus CBS 6039]|uniref:Uncharacterized protein n=2 Tax=Cryptococcus amylolentus TaxID=104669 RepID=A0A1E3HL35_9TREE|nr:hypothetical protein L202_05590 [Cryptococcus amylolentus CBS 6039]ODN77050.1 hypothetical protein L202_05590 [Cryptococcus amylolentus CBS 6039]ODO04908.1 hypothetical protein I350_05518 [Cryptococcus amylolentus CBS 6273]
MPHKRSKKSVRDAETAKKGQNLAPSDNKYDDTPRGATRIFSSLDLQTKFRASGRTNSEDTGERRGVAGTNVKGKGKGKEALPKIMPQETLGEYNRRIESLLRPAVSSAIKTAENQRQAEVADERRGKKERKRRARLEKLVKEGKVDKKVLEEFEKSVKEKKRKREQGKGGDSESEEEEEERGGKKQKQQQKEQKEFKAATSTSAPRRLNDIAQAPPSLPQLKRAGEKSGVYGAVSSGKMPLNAGQKRIMEEERERVINLYREMKAKKQESKSS